MERARKTDIQPWRQCDPSGQLLRPNDVIRLTGLSRSQIYDLIALGRFPPFLKLSVRASAMPKSWLDAFIKMRAEEIIEIQAPIGLASSLQHKP